MICKFLFGWFFTNVCAHARVWFCFFYIYLTVAPRNDLQLYKGRWRSFFSSTFWVMMATTKSVESSKKIASKYGMRFSCTHVLTSLCAPMLHLSDWSEVRGWPARGIRTTDKVSAVCLVYLFGVNNIWKMAYPSHLKAGENWAVIANDRTNEAVKFTKQCKSGEPLAGKWKLLNEFDEKSLTSTCAASIFRSIEFGGAQSQPRSHIRWQIILM